MMSMGIKEKKHKNLSSELNNEDFMNKSFCNVMDEETQAAILEDLKKKNRRY